MRALKTIGCETLFAAWALLGCSSGHAGSNGRDAGASGAPSVYVGDVPGTDARVGVVATTHHARVFLCGGALSLEALTHWVTVDLDDGRARSADAAFGSIDGTFGAASIDATAAMGDAGTLSFRATHVREGTIAGLYEATGPCGKIGLIVSQASPTEAPTAQGACIGPGTRPSVAQVNPLLPLERASDGTIRVTVGGSPPIAVTAAVAPAD